ncbi:RHS repeat-associated core domain-containing protein [Kribbella sp. C-35]|uniref:RHS repeat-associated core domain-containing protein n=1 Tax=Kribbella sp. C-35 TaxID=2789276 RepID=UPI003979D22C
MIRCRAAPRTAGSTVKAGATPTGALDTWSYTYDGRGLRSTITKPNGNLATFTYHEDGLSRIQTEKTSGGKLVSSHSLRYTPDGDRSQDVEKLLKANSSDYLDQASTYTYTPARQLEAVVKSGVEKGDNESYEYDAAGNATKQTIGATTSTMTYDRNRLTKTVTGGTTLNQRYDPFGRATSSDVGTQVVEQNAYDGYDRLVRQQKFDTAGTPTFTRNQTYDPFDRVVNQSEKVGAAASISTRYTFVGLANQVAIEEQKDTAGTWKVSKSYAYGASGENLSLVDSPVNGSTSKKSFYGTNPHGDVETLTDASTGTTTSTYRYTAYGQADKTGTTGDDAIIDNDPAKNADIVNPYRFNSKRFDGATGTYDMGFREYNPGLNRFLTRDMYDGALEDMALGADPWNANRYMFAGGNPVTGVESDGHCAFDPETESACGRPVTRILGSGSTPPPVTETKPTEPSTVQKVSSYFAPGQFGKNVTDDLVVEPVQETYEACKAAIQMQDYQTNWRACQTGIALTGLGFTGGGKALGIGVRTAEGLAAAEAESASMRILLAGRGTVWDGVKATQPNYVGSQLPRSFELVAGDTKVWVHGNATEHIAEYLSGMAQRGATRAQVDLATQVQLGSLQAAVGEAGVGGLPVGKIVTVGGWELKFGAAQGSGQLPVLYHALYKG